MNNLKIRDIAQKNVIKIADNCSIQSAVDLMYQENHRNIIVTSDNEQHRFGLLTANDLIRLRLAKIDFELPINTIKYDRLFAISEDALLSDILDEVSHDIECLCVTDASDNLTGVVFYTEIISSVDPQLLLEKR
ncbi:MAG: CBS domain-containing protein, partial [Oceanospirillum sp.]|nr:CBS domain-containing protein [Oceanospirillum sp.]